MDISWITLRDLEYLTAVADEKNFGRAAARCHISQPSLSQQIKKMERLLDVQIFERFPRTIHVTVRGQPLIDQAKRIMEEARHLVALADEDRGLFRHGFRLGAIASSGPYLFPYLLRAFKKKYPDGKLLLKEGLTHELIASLREGSLDAVIASPTFEGEGLRAIPLFFEPFTIAAPKGHPLTLLKTLEPKHLNASEMVLLEDGHCLQDQAIAICPTQKRNAPQGFQATSLETLKSMVAAGLGYSILPVLASDIRGELANLVEILPFGAEGSARTSRPGRKINLYVREGFSRLSEARILGDLIQERIPSSVTPT